MNTVTNNPAQSTQTANEEGFSFLELLDSIIDNRRLVIAVVATVFTIGLIYTFLTAPIFESNILIQVEETKGNPIGNLVGEASSLFDIKSPATAEIEIIKSRMIVGQAVENLSLDISASPKYIPIIGGWLTRRSEAPSKPGFFGFKGYVTGNESISVQTFEIQSEHEGARFIIESTENGYALLTPNGDKLTDGEVGKIATFDSPSYKGKILVEKLNALPGAHFRVVKGSRLETTEALQKSLKLAEVGRQSGILRATLEGTDRQKITKVLNEIGTLYVRQNVIRKAAEAEKSLNFLTLQAPTLRKELESAEQSYNDFRNKNSTFDLSTEAKSILDQSSALNLKLAELMQKRKEMEIKYTDQHPAMQALDSQIKDYKFQMSTYAGHVKRFPSTEQDLLRLARDVKVSNELYTNMLNTMQQLRMVKEGKVGNVRLVDKALLPERPIRPVKALVLPTTFLLSIGLGVLAAFIKNKFTSGLRDASDVERMLGLSVFATIPHSARQVALSLQAKQRKEGVHLLSVGEPNDPVVESLRSLRTAIQFAMLESKNNMLLITGPTPGIGKSFISANFAAVLAASGKKVLLIDADLRRGHIHQFFGLERGVGFSDLISGSQTLEQVLHVDLVKNLHFLSTGTLPPNPAELLGSQAASDILQTLCSKYDVLLIDTPPVLAVSDSAVLAPLVGSVFLVARAEQTELGELQESTKRIVQAGATLQGIIFNGLDVSKRRYGYGGYKYGYKYSRYRYRYYNYYGSTKD